MKEDLKNTPRRKQALPADRLPPHSIEAEQGILSCILSSPTEILPEVISQIGTSGEHFYDMRHQTLFSRIVEMWEEDDGIDVITLQDRLKVFGELDQIGGIAYLSALPDIAPAANWNYYLEILIEKYTFRKIITTSSEAIGKAFEATEKPEAVLDEFERDVLRIRQDQNNTGTPPIRELVQQANVTIEAMINRNGQVAGIASGFVDFDRLTMGFLPGQMIVIAARPSVGKTSLAMNIAENVAVTNQIPTGVISLEMTAEQLTRRMIFSRARVNVRNIQSGFVAERDFPNMARASGQIATSPIYIEDRSALSIMQIRAKFRRWVQQYGIRLGVIDYLQLAKGADKGRKYESRQQEITDISGGIKSIAKDLGIPIIVLSQLNREIEREKNRKPRLSDLRESGSIEQDADIVTFLYRTIEEGDEEGDEPPPEDRLSEQIRWLIAKQREGEADVIVDLTFLKIYTRFESTARISSDDVPQQQQEMYAQSNPDP